MLKRAHPTCAHTPTHPFPSFLPRFTPTSIKALARGILPYPGAVARAPCGAASRAAPPCHHPLARGRSCPQGLDFPRDVQPVGEAAPAAWSPLMRCKLFVMLPY